MLKSMSLIMFFFLLGASARAEAPVVKSWKDELVRLNVKSWEDINRMHSMAKFSVSCRLMLDDAGVRLRCIFANTGTTSVVVQKPFHSGNDFLVRYDGIRSSLGVTAWGTSHIVGGGETASWVFSIQNLVGEAPGLFERRVTCLNWFCFKHPVAPDVWIAVSDGRPLEVPELEPGESGALLAAIHQDRKDPQLGFFLVNDGTATAAAGVAAASNSAVVASCPAINYTREFALPKTAPVATTNAPGKVAEWRLPWKTVLDLIPKDDLAKIETAGGNLDLVWKIGELTSPILPISLARPTAGIKEQPLKSVPQPINLPDKKP